MAFKFGAHRLCLVLQSAWKGLRRNSGMGAGVKWKSGGRGEIHIENPGGAINLKSGGVISNPGGGLMEIRGRAGVTSNPGGRTEDTSKFPGGGGQKPQRLCPRKRDASGPGQEMKQTRMSLSRSESCLRASDRCLRALAGVMSSLAAISS